MRGAGTGVKTARRRLHGPADGWTGLAGGAILCFMHPPPARFWLPPSPHNMGYEADGFHPIGRPSPSPKARGAPREAATLLRLAASEADRRAPAWCLDLIMSRFRAHGDRETVWPSQIQPVRTSPSRSALSRQSRNIVSSFSG